jgi:hypothetical protein
MPGSMAGTIALDTNASGNSTMNPNEAADSGRLPVTAPNSGPGQPIGPSPPRR